MLHTNLLRWRSLIGSLISAYWAISHDCDLKLGILFSLRLFNNLIIVNYPSQIFPLTLREWGLVHYSMWHKVMLSTQPSAGGWTALSVWSSFREASSRPANGLRSQPTIAQWNWSSLLFTAWSCPAPLAFTVLAGMYAITLLYFAYIW